MEIEDVIRHIDIEHLPNNKNVCVNCFYFYQLIAPPEVIEPQCMFIVDPIYGIPKRCIDIMETCDNKKCGHFKDR